MLLSKGVKCFEDLHDLNDDVKKEIMAHQGRKKWSNVYMFCKVCTIPEEEFELVITMLTQWSKYQCKGQKYFQQAKTASAHQKRLIALGNQKTKPKFPINLLEQGIFSKLTPE